MTDPESVYIIMFIYVMITQLLLVRFLASWYEEAFNILP